MDLIDEYYIQLLSSQIVENLIFIYPQNSNDPITLNPISILQKDNNSQQCFNSIGRITASNS